MKQLLIILSIISSSLVSAKTDTLSLSKAIGIALENNYGIIIQTKNLDISQLNNTWGNAGALPLISFKGEVSESWNYFENDDSRSSSRNSMVELDWVLFRGYSAKIQKSKLNEFEKLSETNLHLATENTIVNVTLAYYRVILMLENMKTAEQLMFLSKDRYEKEELKKELGNSGTYNLLQAHNAWLVDKSNFLSARTNYNNAVRQLNFLMAAPIENNYCLNDEFTADTTSFEKQVLEDKLFSNNNTLKNQYINLETAKLDVKLAKSAFYPTITAGVNVGHSDNSTEFTNNISANQDLNGFSNGFSAGISYTIYNGGQRKQAIQTAKIEEEIKQVETQQMEEELKNQLAQEFELYEVRKELLVVARENVKATEMNMELSTQKFESGAINSFNFRDIQQVFIQSVWNYHNAIYNVIESYNTLLQLTGGIIEKI